MAKSIDYRVIWYRAYAEARFARRNAKLAGTKQPGAERIAASRVARDIMPRKLANSALAGWHIDRIARCAAGETVMSKGISRRAMWLDAAGQMRRYAVSDAVLTNPHGGRADYLALARGLLADNARNASTFVAPLP